MRTQSFVALSALLLATSSACARQSVQPAAVTLAPQPDAAPAAPVAVTRDTLPSTSSGEVREYQGAYSSGYEMSWFEPCDGPSGDSMWWVTLSEEARLQRDSLLKLMPVRPRQGLAVRWRGTVSPKMAAGAGHMGRGSRYMLVTRIITLRALDGSGSGACGPGARVGVR